MRKKEDIEMPLDGNDCKDSTHHHHHRQQQQQTTSTIAMFDGNEE